MPRVALVLRLALAAVFAVAAIAKLTHLDEFAAAVAAPHLVSQAAVPVVVSLTLCAEAALAAALLAGYRLRVAATVSALMLATFSLVTAWAASHGVVGDCGCFPGLLRQSSAPWLYARNGILLAGSVALYLTSPAKWSAA